MSVLTGDAILVFRLKTLKKGIELEGRGIKISRGKSCLSIVKAQLGFKGNRASILEQLSTKIQEEEAKLSAE